MPCCLVCKISKYSESPWTISPSKHSIASEFLIRLALDAIDPSASSPTVIENVFHQNSAARAAEFYAEGAECSSSNSRPSSIDLLKKRWEKNWPSRRRSSHVPKNRPLGRFLGLRDPSCTRWLVAEVCMEGSIPWITRKSNTGTLANWATTPFFQCYLKDLQGFCTSFMIFDFQASNSHPCQGTEATLMCMGPSTMIRYGSSHIRAPALNRPLFHAYLTYWHYSSVP